MITSVHIKNFKCLFDTAVDLAPFTILIGPNDSGKSSLIEAIQLLGRTASESLGAVFKAPNELTSLVSQKDATRHVTWTVEGTTDNHSFSYALELTWNGMVAGEALRVDRTEGFERDNEDNQDRLRILSRQGAVIPIGKTSSGLQLAAHAGQQPAFPRGAVQLVRLGISSSAKYRLDPLVLRSDATSVRDVSLSPAGDNLTAVIDDILTSPDRTLRDALEGQLRTAIPTIAGVTTRGGGGGKKSLEFVLPFSKRPLVTIPAALASDGVVLLTAFLALGYGNTPEVVFIEEPENGLHYSLLRMVIGLLRRMTTGELGNAPRQVIVTTHSPLLLNFAQPNEVRIFRRGEDGGTKVVPMEGVPNIQGLLNEFAPGELWFNLGEDALAKEAKR